MLWVKTLFLISRQIPLGLGQGWIGNSLGCEWPTQHRQNSPSPEYHTCKPQTCSPGGAAQPSQLTNHWHPSAAGIPVRKSSLVTHRTAPGPGTARHGGQQCQPGSTSAAGSAPRECRTLHLGHGCVSRGQTPDTPAALQNSLPPARQQRGVLKHFLEKPQSSQPTVGWCSPASPSTAPEPSPVPAPITDTQSLRPRRCLTPAAARGSGTHGGPR